jgi:ubiquinone/menaquinone biosynthesis C-methylase UbiE
MLINMEDWVFNVKLVLTASVGWVGDKPTAQYRMHPAQACNESKDIYFVDLQNTRRIVAELFATMKPEVTIANYLGLDDNNYSSHMLVEYKAERGLVLGNDRNWEQSFRAQALIPTDAKLVLDLGCGRGYWTDRIASLLKGGVCIGVDAMPEFVEKGREEFKKDFRVMDYHRTEFPDNVFDVIYADNVIEHSPRPDVALAESYRILKHGGTFILLIPPDKLGQPMYDNVYHIWKVDRRMITDALTKAGFVITEFIEFDLVKENARFLYFPAANLMYIIKCKKV